MFIEGNDRIVFVALETLAAIVAVGDAFANAGIGEEQHDGILAKACSVLLVDGATAGEHVMVAVGVGEEGAFMLCPVKQVGARGVSPGLITHCFFHWVVLPEIVPDALMVDHAVGVVVESGFLCEVELGTEGFFVEVLFSRNGV